MKDIRGLELSVGDPVATAAVARHSGDGLRVGVIIGFTPIMAVVELANSGRVVHRIGTELARLVPAGGLRG